VSIKNKGKALAKKVKKSLTRTEDSNDKIEDKELCCICSKFQPDGLRLDMAISFVEAPKGGTNVFLFFFSGSSVPFLTCSNVFTFS
jgi:hypothetical protein